MQRLQLSKNGPELSRMIYGTWRLLDSNPTVQEVNRRLHACLELGITTLDTAEIYGIYEVEKVLGEALSLSPGLRDQFEMVTKAGIYIPCAYHPERQTAFYNATGPRLIKSLEKSLRFLKTDRVELFLVHRPDFLTRADDTAEGLSTLVKSGKVRAVGTSNYTVSQFNLLNSRMDQSLVTNQVEFSLLHQNPTEDGTFAQCEQLGILPMAWSPLAGGKIFDAQNPAAGRLREAAQRLAPRYQGATLEQLALAWIMAHPSRPLPVLGTNRLDRLSSSAQSERICLEREDWYALWEAAQGHPIP